jgi:uncharacterized protein with von Willebrand factor type A (vWA) domain
VNASAKWRSSCGFDEVMGHGQGHGRPDDPGCQTLRFEIERLHKRCRRLVWLNPLLPAHNLDGL